MSGSLLDTNAEVCEELLTGLETSSSSSSSSLDRTRIESDLDSASEAVGQMKMELSSVAKKQTKDKYIAQITNFTTRIAAARRVLLFAGASSNGAPNAAAKAKVQSIEEKQAASLKMLQQANRQLFETQSVGQDTVDRLVLQNEQTKKLRETMDEVKAGLEHGKKIVTKLASPMRGFN